MGGLHEEGGGPCGNALYWALPSVEHTEMGSGRDEGGRITSWEGAGSIVGPQPHSFIEVVAHKKWKTTSIE